jgi:hypothetical protein
MDKTIRKYTNFDEMKADEYRWMASPLQFAALKNTGCRTVFKNEGLSGLGMP